MESFFLELCEEFRIEQFLECGAHDAYASRIIKSRLPGTNVVAYEANPFVYHNYKSLVDASGAIFVNLALSDSNDSLSFVIKDKDSKSWSSEGFLAHNQDDLQQSSFEVACTTLDAELDNRLGRVPTALWIDVEGSNRRLISGASIFLSETDIKFIYIETQVDTTWEDELTAVQLCIELNRFGLEPLVRDWPYHWGCNILFVHESLIKKSIPFLNQYLEKVSEARISYFPSPDIMNLLSLVKRAILGFVPRSFHSYIHKLAAFLGSKSSADLY